MAVPSTVELIVKVTKAVNPLRQVEKQAKKTSEAIGKSALGFEAVSKASLKVKERVEATQGGFAKASKVVGTFSAKVLNTEKAMRAQIRALREVQSTVKFNGAVYKKAGAEIARYEAILRSANRTTDEAKQKNNGFAAGLRKLAIGFGAARAAQATLQASIRRDESERRLRLLTQRFGETAQAQEAAQRAADKFNLSQTEANVQLSRLIARLRPMGLSMATIETAFAGFNTATILAGATASESAGAFLQLSQALGSGVLRGQELNSILEQAPLIAQAISTEMGVTVGALKKLGEEGEITSDIVIKALARVEREGASQLEEALKGPAAAIKDFQNATEDVQVALTEDIIPEMAKSFRELADLIRSLGPLLRGVGGDVGGGLGAINDLIDINRKSKAGAARSILERGRIAPGERGLPELFDPLGGKEFVTRLRTQAANAAKMTGKDVTELFVASLQRALKTLDAKAATLPDNFETMVLTADSPFKKKKSKDGDRVDMSQRLADLNSQLRAAQEGEQQRLAATLKLMVEKQKIAESNLLPVQREDALQEAIRIFRQEIFKIDKEIADQRAKNIEKAAQGFEAQMAHQDELRQAIAEQKSQYEELNTTFRNGIVDSILDAVEGTKSLGDSLLSVIKSMARLILQQQLLNALKGFNIFGGGGGGTTFTSPDVLTSGLDFSSRFANGGRPPVGKAALVGERGPELFVPDRAGTIVPNHAMGGANVTVNVDASGSSVQGDGQQAKALGQAIGAAVQAELIKQKRPGGLLS